MSPEKAAGEMLGGSWAGLENPDVPERTPTHTW